MKKRLIFQVAVSVLASLLLLCACGKTGETPTEPTTTEHIHSWEDATPYTPKTCSVCGATEGEVLQPEFERHGLVCNLEVGKSFEFKTHCSADKTVKTKGTLTVKSFEIFDSDAERAAKAGYEWRVAKIDISFRDLNAYNKGFTYTIANEDYYGTTNRTETYTKISDTEGSYTFRVDEEEKTVTERLSTSLSGWNDFGTNTLHVEYSVQVPKGYDGAVIGFLDPTKRADGQTIFEADTQDALFFQMK